MENLSNVLDSISKKEKILSYLKRSIVFLGLVGLILIYAVLGLKPFFTINNLFAVLQQSATIAIVGFGVTFVVIQGGIDLSVGSIIGLGGISAAFILQATNSNSLAILSVIGIGLVFGLFNGLVHLKAKIPSFLVTLATLIIARGICTIWSKGAAIPIDRKTVVGRIGTMPYIFIALFIIFIFTFILLRYTSFGRYITAIGGKEDAAKFVGINVTRIKLMCFLISSLLAAFGGLVLASRMAAGTPRAGETMELDIIAAIVLGGTPLTGGYGSVERTLLGVLLFTVITNGLTILGIATDIQMVIKGFILILAVSASLDREKVGTVK